MCLEREGGKEMTLSRGWAETILNVDLTRGKIEKEQLSPEFAKKYLGGIGFNATKLFDLVEPNVDALSPGNVLLFSVGPLACSGRAEQKR